VDGLALLGDDTMSKPHSYAGRVYDVYHLDTGETRIMTLTDEMLQKRCPEYDPGPMTLRDMACPDTWPWSDYTRIRTRSLKSAEQLKGQGSE